jgi:hypothetical protein
MKKAYLLAVAVFAFVGCEKIKELADININLDYKETVDIPALPGGIDTIPPGTGVSAYFPGKGFATNSQQYLNQNKTNAELVKHVKLTKLSAVMQQPTSANFDFIDTLRIYMYSKDLEEKLVAYKYGVPKGQTSLEMDLVQDLNMKDYFLKDSMFVRFGGHFVGIPDSNSKVELSTTFNLLANPLQ